MHPVLTSPNTTEVYSRSMLSCILPLHARLPGAEAHEEAFERVYRLQAWGGDGINVTASGLGAFWRVDTAALCTLLQSALHKVRLRRCTHGVSLVTSGM